MNKVSIHFFGIREIRAVRAEEDFKASWGQQPINISGLILSHQSFNF